jgi:hypothetical protein
MNAKAFRARRALLALGSAAALALAGCATPTPYQPLTGSAGGYASQRIEPNRYRVFFAGNSMTSRDRVENYLLFRAAELTLENGYDSFTIVDRATDRNVETRVYPDPFPTGPYGWWRPSWRYYGRYGGGYGWRSWDPWYGGPFWANSVDISTVQRFEATAEIVLERGAPQGARSFDARQVLQNLGPTIEVPR